MIEKMNVHSESTDCLGLQPKKKSTNFSLTTRLFLILLSGVSNQKTEGRVDLVLSSLKLLRNVQRLLKKKTSNISDRDLSTSGQSAMEGTRVSTETSKEEKEKNLEVVAAVAVADHASNATKKVTWLETVPMLKPEVAVVAVELASSAMKKAIWLVIVQTKNLEVAVVEAELASSATRKVTWLVTAQIKKVVAAAMEVMA